MKKTKEETFAKNRFQTPLYNISAIKKRNRSTSEENETTKPIFNVLTKKGKVPKSINKSERKLSAVKQQTKHS